MDFNIFTSRSRNSIDKDLMVNETTLEKIIFIFLDIQTQFCLLFKELGTSIKFCNTNFHCQFKTIFYEAKLIF